VAVGLREERKVVVIAVAVREGCEHHGKVLRIIPGSGEDEQHSRAILAGEFKSPRENAPRAHHAPSSGADESAATSDDPAICHTSAVAFGISQEVLPRAGSWNADWRFDAWIRTFRSGMITTVDCHNRWAP